MNEPAILDSCPSFRLHRSAQLQGQLIEVTFPRVLGNASLTHQPPKISVSADVIEAMVMNSEMADVARHFLQCRLPSQIKKSSVFIGIKLKDRRSILKTLCPLCPPARSVFAIHRKNWGTF